MASPILMAALSEAVAAFAIETDATINPALAQRRAKAVDALSAAFEAHPPQPQDLAEVGPVLKDLAARNVFHLKWPALRTALTQSGTAPSAPLKPAQKLDIVF